MASLSQTKPLQRAEPSRPNRRTVKFNALLFPDVSLDPRLAATLTLVLLLVFTWAIRWLELITRDSRPYTMLYLIPVAFGGAFMGLRGGLASTLVALALARFLAFNSKCGYLHFCDVPNAIEFLALVMGTLFIAGVTGRLHNVIRDLRRMHVRLMNSEERRQAFNRDVLSAVTGGRLMLCDAAELESLVSGRPALRFAIKDAADVNSLRAELRRIVAGANLGTREDDLFTCATEAASNAVKHGNGGTAEAYLESGEVTLVISDLGPGISPANLARATLERGFSTEISLGMGFVMMLEAADLLGLSTSEKGTTVLMRIGGRPRVSMEENLLARFTMGADP